MKRKRFYATKKSGGTPLFRILRAFYFQTARKQNAAVHGKSLWDLLFYKARKNFYKACKNFYTPCKKTENLQKKSGPAFRGPDFTYRK